MPIGVYVRSDAARANMSAAAKRRTAGRTMSPEARAKIAAARRGKSPSKETRIKIAATLQGNCPHNKGKQQQEVLKKVDAFRRGEPIVCEHHGLHDNWRLHSSNNVQCRYCAADSQRRSQRKYPLRFLVRWARRRVGGCRLTEDDLKSILERQGGCCALSGVVFDETNRPSLDRIDSTRGYVKGNVQLVLHAINRMKTDLAQDRFIELCRLVTARQASP